MPRDQSAPTVHQIAQAGGPASAQPIGLVDTVAGSVTAQHVDGTVATLAQGDPVYQKDLIATQAGAKVALVFADKTTFALGESGQMRLDEMVYNPAGKNGKIALSMLKGAFAFVSGDIAATEGDAMAVRTPVGTIGIRGTAVDGQVDPNGISTFSAVPDPSGAHSTIVFTNGAGTQIVTENFSISVQSFFTAPGSPFASIDSALGEAGALMAIASAIASSINPGGSPPGGPAGALGPLPGQGIQGLESGAPLIHVAVTEDIGTGGAVVDFSITFTITDVLQNQLPPIPVHLTVPPAPPPDTDGKGAAIGQFVGQFVGVVDHRNDFVGISSGPDTFDFTTNPNSLKSGDFIEGSGGNDTLNALFTGPFTIDHTLQIINVPSIEVTLGGGSNSLDADGIVGGAAGPSTISMFGNGTLDITNLRVNFDGSAMTGLLSATAIGTELTIEGSQASSTLTGAGFGMGDVLSYAHATSAVEVNFAAGTAVHGGITDSISGFDGVIGSTFDDMIDVSLAGGGHAITVEGGGGDNTLIGALTDFDTLSYADAQGGVSADFHGGSGSVSHDNGDADTFSGFQAITGSSGFNAVTIDGAAGNTLTLTNFNRVIETDAGAATTDLTMVTPRDGFVIDLTGGGGSDTLTVGFGNFGQIAVGAGDDFISLSGQGAVIMAGAGNDTIVETAISNGLYGYDTIGVGGGADSFALLSGVDSVTAGGGADIITGGGVGFDTIVLGGGADTISLTAGVDTISLANGNDVVSIGGVGFNAISLGNGIDGISLGGSSNVVSVGDGNDTIDIGDGFNSVVVGNGNDVIALSTIAGVAGSNFVQTGTGFETITSGGGFNTILAGGNHDDVIAVADGADSISVGNGADTITTGDGFSSILVGNGDDLVTLSTTAGAAGSNFVQTGTGTDTITSGGGFNTILVGGNGNDIISGPSTNNFISVDDGNDLIQLSASIYAGNNTIIAGNGDDTIDLATGSNSISVGSGNDTISASDGFNTIIVGGNGNDTISGPDTNNFISVDDGNDLIQLSASIYAGNNTIFAGSGADTIDLATGSNSVSVTGGNDTISIGGGFDTIVVGSGDDSISLAGYGGDSIQAGTGHDIFSFIGGHNSATISIVGSCADDTIAVSGDDSIAYVGSGDFIAVSGAGGMVAVTGSDDSISAANGAYGLTVSGNDDSLTAGNGDDTITVTGNNDHIAWGSGSALVSVTGDDNVIHDGGVLGGNNTITAVGADDTITVGNGNDSIVGFYAAAPGSDDLITVGTGEDTLAFYGFSVATITINGSHGDDYISLVSGDSITVVGHDDNITFISYVPYTAVTVDGQDDYISLFASNQTLTLLTGDDSVGVNIHFQGVVTANTVSFGFGCHDVVTLFDDNETLTVTGSAAIAIGVAGSDDAITVEMSGHSISVSGGGADDAFTAMGNDDAIVLPGSGAAFTFGVSGTGDVIDVLGNNDAVTFTGADSSIELYGGSDTVATVNNADILVYAGGDSIAGGGNDDVIDLSTAPGNAVTVSDIAHLTIIDSSSVADVTVTALASSSLFDLTQAPGATLTLDLGGTTTETVGGGIISSPFELRPASDAPGVSDLVLENGSYHLTFDGNVVPGGSMTVDASQLGAGSPLYLDVSAELDGTIEVRPGAGADTLIGNGQVTLDYSQSSQMVTLTLTNFVADEISGIGAGGSAAGDQFTNFGAFVPSAGAGGALIIGAGATNLGDIVGITISAYGGYFELDGFALPITGFASVDNQSSVGLYLIAAVTPNETLIGGSGADTLEAEGSGGDSIVAGSGNDSILSLTGGTLIAAGAGTDQIAFMAPAGSFSDAAAAADSNTDVIAGFQDTGGNASVINLQTLSGVGTETFAGLRAGASFAAAFGSDPANAVDYAVIGGNTFIHAATSGGGYSAGDLVIELTGAHTLTGANFHLHP